MTIPSSSSYLGIQVIHVPIPWVVSKLPVEAGKFALFFETMQCHIKPPWLMLKGLQVA
jgi:hypothetical protein